MKSSIVKQMSAVRVETVERIQQTSNVIAQATSDISEVTVEAQVGFPTFYVRHINNLIGVGVFLAILTQLLTNMCCCIVSHFYDGTDTMILRLY